VISPQRSQHGGEILPGVHRFPRTFFGRLIELGHEAIDAGEVSFALGAFVRLRGALGIQPFDPLPLLLGRQTVLHDSVLRARHLRDLSKGQLLRHRSCILNENPSRVG
jgi:hypothetical protein